MNQYDRASAIMTNGYLNYSDNSDSSDAYYLFSEGMEERYQNGNIPIDSIESSEMSGGNIDEKDSDEIEIKTKKNSFKSTDNIDTNIDTDTQPTGGFPPIYIIMKKKEKTESKSRELSTSKKSVSIKDILKKKKI
jgi:hypothetical protein